MSLLESVDFGKHVVEDFVSCGPEVFAAGRLGDSLEGSLVDDYRLRFELYAACECPHRVGCVAVGAYAYGINLHSEFFRNLCGGDGCYYARVVRAVGEEYYALALGFALFEAVERRGNAVAYGCAVFEHAHIQIL